MLATLHVDISWKVWDTQKIMRIKRKTKTHHHIFESNRLRLSSRCVSCSFTSSIFETWPRTASSPKFANMPPTSIHHKYPGTIHAEILIQISPGLPLMVALAPFVRPPGWRRTFTKNTWARNRNLSRQNTYIKSYLYHGLSHVQLQENNPSNSQPHQ